MKHHILTYASTVLLVALLGVGVWSHAGDVNPPAGPVGATMKTLVEVEPRTAVNTTNTPGDADSVFKITQSGSYYLTENVTGESGKSGIEIAAGDVTLDLRGFAVIGVPGSTYGIRNADGAAYDDITVSNGTVRGWGGSGVYFNQGRGFRITDITAADNSASGIYVYHGAIVSKCMARNNYDGIRAEQTGEVVDNCAAVDNGGTGIIVACGTVSNCAASGGQTGIVVQRATAEDCFARDAAQYGICALDSGMVRGCSACQNSAIGIGAHSGSSVVDCVANGNSVGISSLGGSHLVGNTCEGNGAAGIQLAENSHPTVVEGNQCIGNGIGFDVDGTGNLLIHNTARGNPLAYSIAAGNAYGQIINVAGGGSFTNTDPTANFEF